MVSAVHPLLDYLILNFLPSYVVAVVVVVVVVVVVDDDDDDDDDEVMCI